MRVPGHAEGCRAAFWAASYSSLLPTACQAAGPHEQETLLRGGGSRRWAGEGTKGNICDKSIFKFKWKNPSWEPKQLHRPTCSSLCPLNCELAMAGRRQRQDSTGMGIPFCHLISRKRSKGGLCLSLTSSTMENLMWYEELAWTSTQLAWHGAGCSWQGTCCIPGHFVQGLPPV